MIAERFKPFGTTIFTEMTLLAQKHGAVNLAQGFPDFDGPDFAKRAVAAALAEGSIGCNQYARMFGLPALNQAIADAWQAETGVAINPAANVTVTAGCTEAIAAAMLGLVNPGDEVVLFEPYYDSYIASVVMAGGTPRVVTLRAPESAAAQGGLAHPGEFWFDPDELRAALSPRTRVLLLNTPHNPTGKVFSRAELEFIAMLACEQAITVITDEVYERLVYEADRPHLRLATFDGMSERTLTLSSVGKSFSFTGWKVGWAIGSVDLTRGVRAAHQFLTFCAPTPLQAGAAACIRPDGPGPAAARELCDSLRAARSELDATLQRVGFRTFRPSGAYFIIADWSTTRVGRSGRFSDDQAFCRALTAEAGVAAIPPSAFYANKQHARNLARFAFCKRPETLALAAERLERWAVSTG